ncbi:MAG TPA: ATP-binding protein [Myxococcaceae bacterium]|nr:ATP-binding protein [Myxococcaceae bacterium]
MPSTTPSETKQDLAAPAPLGEHGGPVPPSRSWFLTRLDGFLSEPLRRAAPSELLRYRVMVGAALVLLISAVLYLVAEPLLLARISTGLTTLGCLGTLLLLRRAISPTVPAVLLCVSLALVLVVSIFENPDPAGSSHAATMLLPLLAVYLLGPRLGLAVTVLLAVALSLVFPLHFLSLHGPGPVQLSERQFWTRYIFAAVAFVGAWAISALHSTAREAAQRSMERTLKELRESESKLTSLIESTEDVIASIDLQGRVLTANSVAKAVYQQRFGVPLEPGQLLFNPSEVGLFEQWAPRMAQVMAGKPLRVEEVYTHGDTRLVLDVNINPIFGEGGQVVGMTLFSRNITARKEAETRLGEMHRSLVDISRQAGMAEVATGVLHNVGNTLNSVNIATSMLADQLRQSRVTTLAKATQLLREHSPDIATFLSTDPQGKKLPGFLVALSEHLIEEREAMSREVQALTESVDHIKSIVTMQQKHARTAATLEQLSVPQLIDEALRLHAVSFDRLGITIVREYADVAEVVVDRHKLLQILINLLSNARHALVDSGKQDKRLVIRIRRSEDGRRLLIDVEDNGGGIAAENLPRMFTQGFTTKKTGHGFGLHISALAASEMKGQLSCSSPGPGLGATFTLELPMADEEASS